jgi:hypothetical protein
MIKMEKKAEMPFWLVKMVIALALMLILLIIITTAGGFNFEFLDWLKGWF